MHRVLWAGVVFLFTCFYASAVTIYLPESRPLGADIYKSNTENVTALSVAKGKAAFKLVLDKSESSDNDYLMCRGWFPVYANGKMPFDVYIVNAMKTELEESGLYAPDSVRVIKIQLTKIDFSNMVSGSWKLQVKLDIEGQPPVLIDDEFEFSGHFAAKNACERTVTAFMPAVQSLLKKIFSSTEFTAALSK